jgi:hypothetical protein
MHRGCSLRFLIATLALLVTACDVPEVTFADGDAGSHKDVSNEGIPMVDADAAPDGCPQTVPSGADTCCSSSPCVGRGGQTCNCNTCQALHCASWCCLDSNGNLSCVAAPALCN